MASTALRRAAALAALGALPAAGVLSALLSTPAAPDRGAPVDLRGAQAVAAAATLQEGRSGEGAQSTSAAADVLPPTYRFSGRNRIDTALKASQDLFGDAGVDPDLDASAVVLARDDTFPDALAGVPLAVAKDGPLLLTQSSSLHPAVRAEIQRTLPGGSTVYLLGSETVMSADIATTLQGLGYTVERFFGADRYETALDIARRGLGEPNLSFVTTGRNFPDALSAANAAGVLGGAILLTSDGVVPASVNDYLAGKNTQDNTAAVVVGGPAAGAVSGALEIVGKDRYATAVGVAELVTDVFAEEDSLLAPSQYLGLATGTNFPDALSGGAHAAHLGAPMVLTHPSQLSGVTGALIGGLVPDPVQQVQIYGSPVAVSTTVEDQVAALFP